MRRRMLYVDASCGSIRMSLARRSSASATMDSVCSRMWASACLPWPCPQTSSIVRPDESSRRNAASSSGAAACIDRRPVRAFPSCCFNRSKNRLWPDRLFLTVSATTRLSSRIGPANRDTRFATVLYFSGTSGPNWTCWTQYMQRYTHPTSSSSFRGWNGRAGPSESASTSLPQASTNAAPRAENDPSIDPLPRYFRSHSIDHRSA